MKSPYLRVQEATWHLRFVGYIYLVLGCLAVLGSLWFGFLLYGSGPYSFQPEMQQAMKDAGYGTILLGLFAFTSVASVVTGIGLLRAAKWARGLLWFFSVVGLLDFPLGTILSAYSIWVLTRPEGEMIEKPAVR